MKRSIDIINLGKKNYQDTYQLQMEYVNKRIQNQVKDTLFLVEHPSIITIGSSGSSENLLVKQEFLSKSEICLYETNRGGDITYHGPGQLVGYPILNLKNHKKDLHWLLRNYEEVFIQLLREFNIKGERIKGLTGVWVDQKKITAIGIGVKKWVTFHGFAFNIDPNLEHYEYIIPCGINDKGITSLEKLLSKNIKKKRITSLVIKHFKKVFKME